MLDERLENVGLPQVYVAFQMDQYKVLANNEKILLLDKLKLDAKVSEL